MEGWIKLYRRLLEWQWISSPNHLVVFMHLLLRSNFRVTTWRNETILPGHLLTGRKQLASWTGLSETQVRIVLRDLCRTKEIAVKATKNYSIISIANWDLYQGDIQEITNTQPSRDQAVTNTQPHPKNAKNVRRKEGKNIFISPLMFLFPNDKEIQNWLLTGDQKSHETLLAKYSHHILAEEITKAFIWQSTKKKRGAGLYLLNWLSNKNTHGYGANQAQKAVSGSHTINPLSDHEIEILKQAGQL